jgi:hypothetical protein
MGFLSSITKGIGNFVSKAVSAVGKFAGSPIGKLLINVGLTVCTGGVGGLLGGLGSSLLGGAGGSLLSGLGGGLLSSLGGGQLQGLIGGLAQQFLPQAASLLSGSGAGIVGNLFKGLTGGDTGGILNMVKGLAGSIFSGSQATQDVAQHNITEIAASTFAGIVLRQLSGGGQTQVA